MIRNMKTEGLELSKPYDKQNTFPTGAVLPWYLHTQPRSCADERERERELVSCILPQVSGEEEEEEEEGKGGRG